MLFALAVITLLPSVAFADELIKNGDFEAGKINWDFGIPPASQATVSVGSEGCNKGRCLKILLNGGENANANQFLGSLNPGATLLMAAEANAAADASLLIGIYDRNWRAQNCTEIGKFIRPQIIRGEGKWRKFTYQVQIPFADDCGAISSSHDWYAYLYAVAPNAGNEPVFFDGASLATRPAVENGGFEERSTSVSQPLVNWTFNFEAGKSPALEYLPSGCLHGACIRITLNDAQRANVNQLVGKLVPLARYRVSVWAKADAGSNILIGLSDRNWKDASCKTVTKFFNSGARPDTGGWKEYAYDVDVPIKDDCGNDVSNHGWYYYVYSMKPASGPVEFDDVSITEVPKVKNGGFESDFLYWRTDLASNVGADITINSQNCLGGKCLSINPFGAQHNDVYVQQDLGVLKTERNYLLDAQVKAVAPIDAQVALYDNGWRNASCVRVGKHFSTKLTATSDWKPASAFVYVPASDDCGPIDATHYWYAMLYAFKNASTNKPVLFDEVKFSQTTATPTPPPTIYLSNNVVTVEITSEGFVNSLSYNNEDKLREKAPLSAIYLKDGSQKDADNLTQVGGNDYLIKYNNSKVEITLSIIPKTDYFEFSIRGISNPDNEPLNIVRIFSIDAVNPVFRGREWALNASDDTLIVNALPLNVDTGCNVNACDAEVESGLIGASGALITAPKKNYFSAIKTMILENNLPYLEVDGKWFRESGQPRAGYLFTTVTHSNYQRILEYAKAGNFKDVLLQEPLVYGHYNQPYPGTFASQAEMISDLGEFNKNGISAGIHTFLNYISPSDPLFAKANLYRSPIGKLATNASASASLFVLDNNFTNNESFKRYVAVDKTFSPYFYVDDELVRCKYKDNTLSGCTRGLFNTGRAAHGAGAPIDLLPPPGFSLANKFFIAPGSDASLISARSFADFLEKINASFVYADGYVFNPLWYIDDPMIIANNREKYGVLPYIGAMTRKTPIQYGGQAGSFSYYYRDKAATNDGMPFKVKEYTKILKVPLMRLNTPFTAVTYELGWWDLVGANFNSGILDFDATTLDDTHYAMTKALASDSSMGLHLRNFTIQNKTGSYLQNKKLFEILNLIGLYNRLIAQDASLKIIPHKIKSYLSNANTEAELNNVSGYNLVEKRVYQQYAIWSPSSKYRYNITNPFEAQPPKIELRPKFDYYPFSDSRHVMISDFLSGATVSGTKPDISCTLSDGTLNINYDGSTIVGCVISIPGTYNLTGKRGVGISLTGDGKNELVVVNGVSDARALLRDYKFKVDFQGTKELSLGDPTGDPSDCIGSYCIAVNPKMRHDVFNYAASEFKVYVYVTRGSYRLQFHSLKGLQEKGASQLVNPTISINGKLITFPVTLSVNDSAPSILEYDGFNKRYVVYDTNYERQFDGTVSTDAKLEPGTNSISISSDTTDPEYSTRADVRISAYDDEDGDRIPSNGNYDAAYLACNGANNFCDDNCHSTYNPNQKDSNSNGVGDACEGTQPVGGKPYSGSGTLQRPDTTECGNEVCEQGEIAESCPADCATEQPVSPASPAKPEVSVEGGFGLPAEIDAPEFEVSVPLPQSTPTPKLPASVRTQQTLDDIVTNIVSWIQRIAKSALSST